jgi:mono/diheme cytochrome c family protein
LCLPQPPRPNEFGPTKWLRTGCLLTLAVLLGGCEKTFENMYDQSRYKPLAPSPLWADGRSSRAPVGGTVAHSEGTLADSSSGRLGQVAIEPEAPSRNDKAQRATWTFALLERGQQRFGIFCAPCHGDAGDGDGMIARRGFPQPASFHIDRLRDASDEHLYAVITRGYGAMYSFGASVPPDDRRAIVAYIRALQLSRNARLADLPADARQALERSSR